jgi:large subunit ribosomal protein L17
MRKRKKGKKLSREKNQRKALMRSLATNLIERKRIKTTLAKAKELRPFIEKKITLAKRCLGKSNEVKVAKTRLLRKDFSQKTVKEIFELAELFKERSGGYVRITKVVARRSDGASMAIVDWTEKAEKKEVEEKKSDKNKKSKEKKEKEEKKKEIKK